MEEQSMFEMQLRVISHFRSFFTQEGQVHFDVAFLNMEIGRLNAELKQRDEKLEELMSQSKAPDSKLQDPDSELQDPDAVPVGKVSEDEVKTST